MCVAGSAENATACCCRQRQLIETARVMDARMVNVIDRLNGCYEMYGRRRRPPWLNTVE